MLINVFRQSRCLNTSDSICDLFKWVCDRNDRNDKGNGKSYVRANDRGLWISCHSCHLCHWGVMNWPQLKYDYYLLVVGCGSFLNYFKIFSIMLLFTKALYTNRAKPASFRKGMIKYLACSYSATL